MKIILRFAGILFIINLTAASVLSGVYYATKSTIDSQQRLGEEQALRQVMPESAGGRIELAKSTDIRYWKVFKGDSYKPEGYIFIAKKYGYSSEIETMVGMKKDGTITGVRILNQNETPGLGAKIVEVSSDSTIFKALKDMFSKDNTEEKEKEPYFTEQFKGLNVKNISLSKGGVDAITGATISSKACVESIREQGLEILSK